MTGNNIFHWLKFKIPSVPVLIASPFLPFFNVWTDIETLTCYLLNIVVSSRYIKCHMTGNN